MLKILDFGEIENFVILNESSSEPIVSLTGMTPPAVELARFRDAFDHGTVIGRATSVQNDHRQFRLKHDSGSGRRGATSWRGGGGVVAGSDADRIEIEAEIQSDAIFIGGVEIKDLRRCGNGDGVDDVVAMVKDVGREKEKDEEEEGWLKGGGARRVTMMGQR